MESSIIYLILSEFRDRNWSKSSSLYGLIIRVEQVTDRWFSRYLLHCTHHFLRCNNLSLLQLHALLKISDEPFALDLMRLTNQHILIGAIVEIRKDLPIDFCGVTFTLHQCLKGNTIFRGESFVNRGNTTVLGNSITDTPGVDLPRLTALIGVLLKHPWCRGEVWHDFELLVPERQARQNERLHGEVSDAVEGYGDIMAFLAALKHWSDSTHTCKGSTLKGHQMRAIACCSLGKDE